MRIYWRDFVGTRTFKLVEALLFVCGYRLCIVFDESRVCKDAFIETLRNTP
jgi:hypothetical protein